MWLQEEVLEEGLKDGQTTSTGERRERMRGKGGGEREREGKRERGCEGDEVNDSL